jgi:20S proteasome alpha/beta subunit
MTTIAYRDGVMAADSAMWQGDLLLGTVQKIYRLDEGHRLAGFAGDLAVCQRLIDLLRANPKPPYEAIKSCGDGGSVLMVDHSGCMWAVDTDTGGFCEMQAPFVAIGSGAMLAMGRMDGGGTARDAIETACKFDGGSRVPVQVEFLNGYAK